MKKVKYYSKWLLKRLKDDHVSAYAAQTAFFTMLSFIPFLMLLLTMIQYTGLTKSDLTAVAVEFLPDALDQFVVGIVDEVYERGALAVSLSALTALWSSGKAFFALTRGLNTVFGVEEKKGYIMLRVRAAVFTMVFVVVIVLSLLLLVFGDSIHKVASEHAPLLAVMTGTIMKLKNAIALVSLAVFFVVLYYLIPNRKAPLGSQVPGAVFASVGWSLYSAGFSFYIDRSSGMADMYGSMTTLILVMLWLYFCIYLLLIGAEINVMVRKLYDS